MSPFAPLTQAEFQYVAMGKARGYTWEKLAAQTNLPLVVLECLPWTHEKLWNHHLTKAERLVARETITEVSGILRVDVRQAEPHLHASLTNSLTRLLKLQQDYSPPRRPSPTPILAPIVPTPAPTPTPPTSTTPAPAPTAEVGPSLSATVVSLLGFFLLLGTLFVGCWRDGRRSLERTASVSEPVALIEAPDVNSRRSYETASPARVVLTPPPWVREPCVNRHEGT